MSIEAMKLALDALEHSHATEPMWKTPIKEAITELRTAIEQAEKQEPFGYFQLDLRLDAWVMNRHSNKGTPFYTTPPQRKPLSDEEITTIVREAAKGSAIRRDGSTSHRIARAIEAAHGIKENT